MSDNDRGLLSDGTVDSHTIRKKFIDFYVSKNHVAIEPVNLLPAGDASLLFVNSGMFPLVPYLLGKEHPQGTRLVNSQRCFRTDDIDEVGDHRHTTCFEMLGNWSLGDYFKEEQIPYLYEFLVEVLGLDPTKLYQSVYGGDDLVPADEDAVRILQEVYKKYNVSYDVGPKTTGKGDFGPGVACDFATQRIFAYGRDKNRWQRGNVVGEIGGPDTETFFDTGKEHDLAFGEFCHPNCDCGRFIEIGNSVFMQYKLTESGWEKLDRQNVDFGGGLERIVMAVQNQNNVFLTDVFSSYISLLEEKYGVSYEKDAKNLEIIVDHCRAITFLLMDGAVPSNKDQGYYLRRLIRRVLTKLKIMDIPHQAMDELIEAVIQKLGSTYTDMVANKENMFVVLHKEVQAFAKNLNNGMTYFAKITANKPEISGDDVFLLQTTYGFPVDIITELGVERGVAIDIDAYHQKVEEHKNISRQGMEKKFKSGLGDNSIKTVQYHTATHLLHDVLRKMFGESVQQMGSNITAERLRFDFSSEGGDVKAAIPVIEERVNAIIAHGFVVTSKIMQKDTAFSSGALGFFGQKYPDEVSVYTMTAPDGTIVSKEICTGPHVQSANELVEAGAFRITEMKSIGQNTMRVKAVFIEK